MIVFKNEYSEEQLNSISAISERFSISKNLAKIIVKRGVDTIEKAEKFLYPGKHNFCDPYLLKGMKEATERLKQAKEYEESVIVFGDYDADGICASTVLTKALKEFGIKNVHTVVPERVQGYGLTHDLVESMLERYEPDLVITVDCGISCVTEVAFIEDVGVDVIVTDHHEIPEVIPDCTVVNCKLKDQEYPCDCLCGAGVAYKLSYALIGDKADKYLDLVAVATIADSMLLVGENRDLVTEGLKVIKTNPNPALKRLIELSGSKEVTSTSLAFTIAPRINAAGRMGDANSALKLMLESDPDVIFEYCNKLNDYNSQRQLECDVLLKSAKCKIEKEGLTENAIVLADDSWNGGLVGIVAAKLVEEFNRPVVLFTKNEGFYHGSARSIDSINIFQAVNSCRDLLVDFGGHAQAAGITIKGENLPEFSRRLTEYIGENYDKSVFVPDIEVEDMVDEKFTISFASELNKLEPFGTGNKKPVFCIEVGNVNASVLKPNSPHLSFRTEYIDLLYFNGVKDIEIINSPANKYIVFEPNVSSYNNKLSLKGYVRDFEYKVVNNERLKFDCFKHWLLSVFNNGGNSEICDNERIAQLIEKYKHDSQTIFAVYDIETLRKLKLGKMDCRLYKPSDMRISSELVFSLENCNAENVKRVIYLDKPFAERSDVHCDCKYYIPDVGCFKNIELSTSHELFAKVFKVLKFNRFYGKSSVDVALGITNQHVSEEQIIFCLEVFIELGIFSFYQGSLQYNSKVRSDLTNSSIYRKVVEYNKLKEN